MRVLYLCHRIPYPPDKGDKIRAFHQLRAIASRHEVDVFTLADNARDLDHRDALAAHCNRLTVAQVDPAIARLQSLPFLLTRSPLTVPYFHSPELKAEVRKAVSLRSYDRIFVYCSAMAQYLDPVHRIPTLMDLVDVDSDKWTQYASHTRFPFSAVYRREGRTLQAYERKVCERAACVLVSTGREAQLARGIAPGVNVHVLPNGVDTEYFRRETELPSEMAVIFTGDMSYFPNEEAVVFFARQVLPLVQQAAGPVRFLIVGRNPGKRVRKLEEVKGVEVTGFVPDVRTWLAKARVAVAPFTIAAGIQNKILEAMAFGLPVVATPRAAQGLSVRIAKLVDQGNTAEELAAKVTELLRDLESAHAKGTEGRRLVMEDYSWDHAHERLLKLLETPATHEFHKLQTQPSSV